LAAEGQKALYGEQQEQQESLDSEQEEVGEGLLSFSQDDSESDFHGFDADSLLSYVYCG
jgi:hypothetical protein